MNKPNLISGLIFIFIFIYSHFSFAQFTLEDSLVGYYPFNGNAIDESGNGNNGIVNGAILGTDRNLIPNSAYNFDGIDDCIEIQNDFDFPNRSIVAWFFARSVSNLGHFYIYNSDNSALQYGNTSIRIWDLDSTNTLQYFTGGGASLLNIAFNLGTWYMASLVVGTDSNYYYLNDSLVGVEAAENLSVPFSWLGSRIGCRTNNGNFFDGFIDDVLIYNRSLSPLEIDSIYNGSVILNIDLKKLSKNNIQLYPNPTNDFIYVKFGISAKNSTMYQIKTMNGKVFSEGIFKGTNNRIGLENIPPAMYLLTVELNGKKETFKVFKN